MSSPRAPYPAQCFLETKRTRWTGRGGMAVLGAAVKRFGLVALPTREVPQESYFAQFGEASGHQSRVPLKVLLEMQEHGWIRRAPQGPQKCDYWEITDQGREAIPGSAGNLHNHQ